MRNCVLLLLLIAVTGCSSDSPPIASPGGDAEMSTSEQGAVAEETVAEETVAASTTADDADVIVIDVRSKEEWDTGHVEQAVHIPHTEIGDRIAEVTDDKDAKIVLYCAVGGRAGRAKTRLEELGFTNVENAGGFDDVKDRFQQ